MSPRPRATAAAAATAALGLLLAGCTDDGTPGGGPSGGDPSAAPSTAAPSASGAARPDPAGPGERAEAYEVPAVATPAPLDDLGTLRTGEWTMTVNGLRRTGEDALVLTATLESNTAVSFSVFEEPGFVLRDDGEGPSRTFEFSAVTLTADGDQAVYRVMRDDAGVCVCYQGVQRVPDGPFAVHALLTAPPGATTVDVTVAGLGTVPDVPVEDA